jgi:hypothetical protein
MHVRVGAARFGEGCLITLPDLRVSDRFSTRLLTRGLVGLICGFVGAAALLMVGCSRPIEPQPFVSIEHEISPQPARVGPVTVTFMLSDVSGNAITGAHIEVETDMSHAGMSPGFAEAKETEMGHYQAHLEFQMAGDWVILLHVTLPDGKKLERQIDVRGVRPN